MNRRSWTLAVFAALISLIPAERAYAQHQPVMDMAPRWQGGWGFQVRNTHRFSDELVAGDSALANPFGRDRRINTTWLEGVYTLRRELRFTVKIPWVDQRRTVAQAGPAAQETGSGLGDVVLGLQLKRYYNKRSSTGNFGLTPSVRLPTGSTSNVYPVGDGSLDVGLSAAFSAEMANLYQYYVLYYWRNGEGTRGINQGDELGFAMNVGIHPYHDNLRNIGVFLMGDLSARYEARGEDTAGTTGGKRIALGPVLVAYMNNMMVRAELRFPVYETVLDSQISHGTDTSIGIGFTF